MPASRTGPATQPSAGFTLLEILAVLAVLGLLMVTLAEGTRFGLRAWQSQARLTTERSDLDAVDRTLRTLIERMNPGGFEGDELIFTGNSRSLSFRSELPLEAGAMVTRQAEIGVGVDPGHRLQLRYAAHYHHPIGPPPAPANALLLEGVDHIDIAYFRPGAGRLGGYWLPVWTEPVPPSLIRIRIVFTDPGRRRWPDIVAGPKREAWHL